MILPVFENSGRPAGKQDGFIVLMSVVLLSVIGVTIVTSLVLLGLISSRSNFAFTQSQVANYLAAACAEQALDSLRQDAGYTGNETVTMGTNSCQIFPVVQNESGYEIQTQASVLGTIRRARVSAQRIGDQPAAMQVISWQEVGDF